MKFDRQALRNLLLILCGVIAFNFLLNNLHVIPETFKFIFNLLIPFVMGGTIAFIVNVPMKKFEEIFLDKTKMKQSTARLLSILLAVLLVIGIVVFVVFMVVPSFMSALVDLFNTLPELLKQLSDRLIDLFDRYPQIAEQLGSIEENFNDFLAKFMTNLGSSTSHMVSMLFGIVNTTIGTLFNLVVGFVFAIYILLSKETLKHQSQKLLFASMNYDRANYVLDFFTLTNHIFSQFLTGQFIEAFINGGLFFVATYLLKLPYPIVISVFMGFAALIPYFGALIGTVIATMLIASQSISQALLFLVVAIILQQIDGNLIYPRVVGKQIGLPAIWVLVAVTIGASLWGVIGMVVMVPFASVLYALTTMWVNRRLERKHIDVTQLESRKMGHLFPKKDGSQDDHTI